MESIKVIKILYAVILVLCFILSGYSTYLFMTGFHNSDLGMNLLILSASYGQNVYDTNSKGEQWDGTQLYSYGQSQLRQSIVLLGLVSLIFGFALKGVVTDGKK